MRILFITNVASPYRVSFLSELGKHSDLTVFFEGKKSALRNFDMNDKNITSFKAVFFDEVFNHKKLKFSLIKRVLVGKYDKIIVGFYSTRTESLLILLLKIFRINYYFESDGGLIPKKESKLKFLVKKILISGAKGYFSTGEKCDNYLLYYGAKKEHLIRYRFTSLFKHDIITHIPTKEQRLLAKKELKIQYRRILIGVGQFIDRKGFDVLLESAKYFSNDIGIYLIGGNPTEKYLKIQEKLNLNNVHYINFLTKQELNTWYLAADLFVLPTREDIWGLVINEAMAKALPVITTNNCLSGIELLKNKECLTPVGNSEHLGQLIDKIIEDDTYLETLAEINLETIKEYTFEQMALDHYNEFKRDDI